MPKTIPPGLYHRYKLQVLEMSPAIQYYEGTKLRRDTNCLSDREIAEKLGLDVDDVTEIRCIAEVELLPPDTWVESAKWKQEKAGKRPRRQSSG